MAPSVDLRSAFLAMVDEFEEREPHNFPFYAPARDDFAAYVQGLLDEERGRNVREGFVPCTHRWLVTADDAVAGATRFRHRIDTDFLAHHGGHIGYDIAPSHRRRGHGHFALRVALDEAARAGLDRALLYTAEDNRASRAVIERAGGVLEAVAWSTVWNESVCKYWVPVAA